MLKSDEFSAMFNKDFGVFSAFLYVQLVILQKNPQIHELAPLAVS